MSERVQFNVPAESEGTLRLVLNRSVLETLPPSGGSTRAEARARALTKSGEAEIQLTKSSFPPVPGVTRASSILDQTQGNNIERTEMELMVARLPPVDASKPGEANSQAQKHKKKITHSSCVVASSSSSNSPFDRGRFFSFSNLLCCFLFLIQTDNLKLIFCCLFIYSP